MRKKKQIKIENTVFDDLFNLIDIENFHEQSEEEKIRAEKYIKEKDFVRLVAVDESGRFEDRTRLENDDFIFIGGLIADIPLKENESSENAIVRWKSDIINMLNNLCNDFNSAHAGNDWIVKVPYSLHSSYTSISVRKRGNEKKIVDSAELSKKEQVKFDKYKKEFSLELKAAVKSYVEQNFKIFVYLLPKKHNLPMVEKSNVNDLSIGANLYEDMVITATENAVFYDAFKEINNVSLQMATRTLPTKVLNQEDAVELYNYRRKDSDEGLYTITNTSFVKTALMHKIRYGKVKNKDIHISFYVDSIDYNFFNVSKIDREDKINNQAFLYLSDILCSIIREGFINQNKKLNQNQSEDITLDNQVQICRSFDRNKYDVRIYSEADRYYRDMIDYINYGELDDYYSIKYDFLCNVRKEQESNGIFKYYNDRFVCNLDNLIVSRIKDDSKYREKIINSIPQFYAKTNGLMGTVYNKYEKGMSIAKALLGIIEMIGSMGRDGFRNIAYKNAYVFRFNDIIIRGHNHRGDVEATREYVKKCEELKLSIGIEEYLEHCQRAVQLYFNSMEYDYIVDVYLKNVIGRFDGERWDFSPIEKLKDALMKLSGRTDEGNYLLAGKIYGTIAQAMAFKRSKQTDLYFDRALREVGDDFGNRDITNSYRLHHYIDMGENGKREEYIKHYEKVAAEYFGIKYEDSLFETLQKQLDIVISGLNRSDELRFALFIFVKAFRVFYVDDNRLAVDEIKELIKVINDKIKLISSSVDDEIHPWQLIYKNMFEITKDSFYFDRIISGNRINQSGPTIISMIVKFKLDYMKETVGELIISDTEIEKLREIPGFENLEKSDFNEMKIYDVKKKLNDKLTYMYD